MECHHLQCSTDHATPLVGGAQTGLHETTHLKCESKYVNKVTRRDMSTRRPPADPIASAAATPPPPLPFAMVPPPPPPRPLRLLCLHGYRQSASVFRARTGALRKALGRGRTGGGALAELIYLDAPFVVEREDTPPPPPPQPSPPSATGGDFPAVPTTAVAVADRAAAAPAGAAPRTHQRTWGLPVRFPWLIRNATLCVVTGSS